MSQLKRVAVIMGGVSGEHDVSLRSGAGVLANLMPDKYVGTPVVIERDGTWRIGDGEARSMLTALQELVPVTDVAFLALHGPNGEDGTIQALCHLLKLPYTGSDYYASSLAMNKPRTKDVYARAGLAVADHVMLDSNTLARDREKWPDQLFARLSRPVVVKTTKLGSSVGVGIARDEKELAELLDEVMPLAGEVMVERFIRGTEVTAPVVDNPYTGETLALPLIEIRPNVADWFDYRAKYELGGSEEICPAPIPTDWTRECQRIGLLAHRLLGCRGMSRTDILIDEDGICHVVETNTIPGFTATSLLPQAAAEAGISYPELVDLLLQEALTRNAV